MSCELQGFYDSAVEGSDCSSNVSVAGITHVWLIPFNDVSDYTYTNDYPHSITGYSSLSVPVLYRPNDSQSEYKGEYNQGTHRMWTHTLSLSFIKMTTEKRRELIAMEDLDLVAIFKDKNGLCWIMGQDYPVKLKQVGVSSGTKGGENTYEIELQSVEKQHIRAIDCPAEGCFVSFNAIEQRQSYFTITNATSLDWTDLELVADTSVYPYTPSTAIDLTQWDADANKAASDQALLTQMFNLHGGTLNPVSDGAGGTIDNPVFIWDSGANTLSIVAFSPDTTFVSLTFGGLNVYTAAIEITLNIKTILSAGIANSSTQIKLEDSSGTVYQTGYGQSVAATNITGTSDDVTIVVSSEYPTGTTFTLSVPTLACSSQQYEYLYEDSLSVCSMSREYEFWKGEQVKLTMPVITNVDPDAPRFQTMEMNLNGVVHSLYKNYTEWHNDFNQFQTDVINSITQYPGVVNASSLVFTDNTTSIDIEFRTMNINNQDTMPFFRIWNRGLDAVTYTNERWIQSREVQVRTTAPYPAIITHANPSGDTTSGQVLGAFTTTDLELVNVPQSTNSSIEDVAIRWGYDGTLGYTESTALTTSGSTPGCVLSDINGALTSCYDGFTSKVNGSFVTLSLDVTGAGVNLNSGFKIEGTFGNISTILPVAVSPNNYWQWLTGWMSSIKGIRVMGMDYSTIERKYYIHVKMDNGVSITKFVATDGVAREFTISTTNAVYLNTTDAKINPYATLDWTLPLVGVSTTTGAHDLMHGHWIETEETLEAIEVGYDTSADELSITKMEVTAATADTVWIVTLHEDYPTQSNNVFTGILPAGIVNVAISGVSATLTANGSSNAAVNYIAYTNYMAQRFVLPFDATANSAVIFEEPYITPQVWGTVDAIQYVGTSASSTPTIVTIC